MTLDIVQLQTWIGKTESRDDLISATPVQGLVAMLDRDVAEPRPGDPIPPGGHWLYAFTPIPRQSTMGIDGHPKRGGFLPPVSLPRRMWAASTIEFRRPLKVGDTLTRRSTVVDVSGKEGRSGNLIFVRVRHEFGDGRQVALIEDQDIVYRDGQGTGAPERADNAVRAEHDFERTIEPSATLLFRYSALTHNGHRIHYDRPYAMDVEGYPGLVVHGPLIATLLLDLLQRNLPDAALATFKFRAIKPLFDTASFKVFGRCVPDSRMVRLWAETPRGDLAMDATAMLL